MALSNACRCHIDRPARVLGDVGHRRLGLVDRLQNVNRAVILGAAMFGRVQPPGRVVEQAHAEMFFEFGDSARSDGGRDLLVTLGFGHASQFVDPDKHSDVFNMWHGASNLSEKAANSVSFCASTGRYTKYRCRCTIGGT